MKTALVISGGGAKGAFAAGAVKYLYQTYRGTGWFDIVGGTSTGALITPLAASLRDPGLAPAALLDLEKLYTTVRTRDILDQRNIFVLLFKRDALNGTAPLKRLIDAYLTPERFAYLRSPTAPDSYVAYTDFRTGEAVYASPRAAGMDLTRFRQAVLASSSIPLYMECARIDGHACYDGGVRELLPLRHAIDLGAESLLPIPLDPSALAEDAGPFTLARQVIGRTLGVMIHEELVTDIHEAELINSAVRAKADLRAQFASDPAALARIEAVLAAHPDLFGPERRLLRLRTDLRPDRELAADSLEFDPVLMRRWFDDGLAAAARLITSTPF